MIYGTYEHGETTHGESGLSFDIKRHRLVGPDIPKHDQQTPHTAPHSQRYANTRHRERVFIRRSRVSVQAQRDGEGQEHESMDDEFVNNPVSCQSS